ncbi:MAG: hypothetical protein K6F14_03325 [Clostridiales bacterium]|nr:hypothetical protein [Clostridiales bacterium]
MRENKKSDKEYWNKRLRQIFAECDLNELRLLRNLADSDNKPLKTNAIPLDDYSREVKVNGIKENLYQIIEQYTSNTYGYSEPDSVKVRISVPVFKRFKKEFNKYGRCRLPEKEQNVRSKR